MFKISSEKLAEWMEQNGYAFAGLLRGHTIEMPDENGSGLTELQAPVIKKIVFTHGADHSSCKNRRKRKNGI